MIGWLSMGVTIRCLFKGGQNPRGGRVYARTRWQRSRWERTGRWRRTRTAGVLRPRGASRPPGDGVALAYFGPDEETGAPGARRTWVAGGTSFAAPMVTGGLAVMKHGFRGQLSNTDLLAPLPETADRSGRYADAKTYGRGLMDLAAATSPMPLTDRRARACGNRLGIAADGGSRRDMRHATPGT